LLSAAAAGLPAAAAAPLAATPAPASLRKLRRSVTALSSCLFIFSSFSGQRPNATSELSGSAEPERAFLDLEEDAAHRAQCRIQDGRFGLLKVAEEVGRPTADMCFEEALLLLRGKGSAECAVDHSCHHLAERGDVVLRLLHRRIARDTKTRHVLPQLCQRLLVEKAGQVIGA